MVRGFSLIELVLVVVILGTIAAFVGPMLSTALEAYDTTEASTATYGKMRYALERMAREIREVRRSTADTANFDISAMTATTLTFVKNDAQQVTIAYPAGSGTVTVNYVAVASGVLTDRVNEAPAAPCVTGFRYFQQGNVLGATAATVSAVEIGLTLREGTNDYCNRVRVDLRTPQ